MNDSLVLYHHPQSRSSSVRVLLEELGVPYAIAPVDIRAGEQRRPEFLALNPMGKLPTLVHQGVVVTEQVAIFLYLADRFHQAGLAPAISDPLRGPYLRWMAFYAASFEPAVIDRALKRDAGESGMSAYGDFERVMAVVGDQLAQGPHLLGERYTAADVLWAGALRWTTGFGIVPKTDAIAAYLDRITARPAFARAAALDAGKA